MTITDRIKRSVKRRADLVFRPCDFQAFGSKASVKRALKEMMTEGLLVRLGVGVYAKAKPSVLTGRPIPAKPLEVLVPEILKKFGVQAGLSRQAREYNAGVSTQVPAGIVVNIGERRIQRKLGFNGKLIRYERT